MSNDNRAQFINLTWRLALVEWKLRNEGSYLGILWYLLNPLLLFLVLSFVFSRWVGNDIELYPAYLLMGILMFNFFSRTTIDAASVVKDSGFIKSFAFTREALIASVVLKHVFVHIPEIFVMAGLFIYFGVPSYAMLFYVPVLFLFALFTYGVGLFLAALTVHFVDLGNVWQFLILLLWFGTPIFYSIEGDALLSTANTFNPLYYFITAAREGVVYGQLPEMVIMWGVIIATGLSLLLGHLVFIRLKPRFAELI